MIKGYWKKRLEQEFVRGQKAVKVSMHGPGIDDVVGPVYFTGIGAVGEIIIEKSQMEGWMKSALESGKWPIRWWMQIEAAVPLNELCQQEMKTLNERIAEEGIAAQERWEADLKEKEE